MESFGSANATITAKERKALLSDFIFEVADSSREATVGSHVGIANHSKRQFEGERLQECLFLEDAAADNLAGYTCEHFVFTCAENVDLCNLRLLVELLGAKLDGFASAMVLRLCKGRLK